MTTINRDYSDLYQKELLEDSDIPDKSDLISSINIHAAGGTFWLDALEAVCNMLEGEVKDEYSNIVNKGHFLAL